MASSEVWPVMVAGHSRDTRASSPPPVSMVTHNLNFLNRPSVFVCVFVVITSCLESWRAYEAAHRFRSDKGDGWRRSWSSQLSWASFILRWMDNMISLLYIWPDHSLWPEVRGCQWDIPAWTSSVRTRGGPSETEGVRPKQRRSVWTRGGPSEPEGVCWTRGGLRRGRGAHPINSRQMTLSPVRNLVRSAYSLDKYNRTPIMTGIHMMGRHCAVLK